MHRTTKIATESDAARAQSESEPPPSPQISEQTRRSKAQQKTTGSNVQAQPMVNGAGEIWRPNGRLVNVEKHELEAEALERLETNKEFPRLKAYYSRHHIVSPIGFNSQQQRGKRVRNFADITDDELDREIEKRLNEGREFQRLAAYFSDNASADPSQSKKSKQISTPVKQKKELPPLPACLSWPMNDYGDWLEANPDGGGIIAYLRQEWQPILDASRRDKCIYVDRRVIADHYPGVIFAIKNYTRTTRGGINRKIPEELLFPTTKEVNDHALGSDLRKSIETDPRLAIVVATRIRRGSKIPGF